MARLGVLLVANLVFGWTVSTCFAEKLTVPYLTQLETGKPIEIDTAFLKKSNRLLTPELRAAIAKEFSIRIIDVPETLPKDASEELKYFAEDTFQQGFVPRSLGATAQFIPPFRGQLSMSERAFRRRPYLAEPLFLFRDGHHRVDVVHEFLHFLIEGQKDSVKQLETGPHGEQIHRHERLLSEHYQLATQLEKMAPGDEGWVEGYVRWLEFEMVLLRTMQFEELAVFRLTVENGEDWGLSKAECRPHLHGFGHVLERIALQRLTEVRRTLFALKSYLPSDKYDQLIKESKGLNDKLIEAARWYSNQTN